MARSHVNCAKVDSYLDYLRFLLKAITLFGNDQTNSWKMKILDWIHFSVLVFSIFHVTALLLVNHVVSQRSILEDTVNLSNSMAYAGALMILIHFKRKKALLYELTVHLESNFRFRSARGLTNATMQQSYLLAKRYTIFYLFFNVMAVVCYTLSSIQQGDQDGFNLPFDVWYPVNTKQSISFVVVFALQLLGQSSMGLVYSFYYILLVSQFTLLCGQLDLLCCSLSNIRQTALLQSGVRHKVLLESPLMQTERGENQQYSVNVPEAVDSAFHYDHLVEHKEISQYFDLYDRKYDQATEAALVECISFCNMIKEHKTKLENLTSSILFVHIITCTLLGCFLLYSSSKSMDLEVLTYEVAIMYNVFLYCYNGNQVTVQADRVSYAAYQSLWYTSGPRQQKLLNFFLLSVKKPMAVKAGPLFYVNLNTFIAIFKTSFSYYTMLRAVDGD